ncbi:hypothetical protein C8F04DRAFT_1074812 [Mycena alexandri]|uniref:Uncharacterized protein n=1 Tax=Mycena alexandri TaxID=1745969 RepID=A0AAD6TCD0_9AGAR|nr:hypothetical protein C8F04DRAFT_1074812 [Mycena alexandri]
MASDEPLRQAMHLPDEIISEILSPALRVSDEAFSYVSQRFGGTASPFMTFTESTSALLVVCKAWLRVATPLLYNVVILRSKAQAQALAATLTATPALGGFIRKLRAEGGYAISMFKILQTSRNITDLFLSVEFASGDNACGLCKGLHLLDPVRIIVEKTHTWSGVSKNAQKLLDTLEQCIPNWKKLAVFQLDHFFALKAATLINALSQAPNLSTFVVLDHRFYLERVPQYMKLVATNSALKRIRLEPPGLNESFRDDAKKNKTMNMLLNLADLASSVAPVDPSSPIGTDDTLSISFVYPPRLAADSAQEEAIWSRVLCFALYDDISIPRYHHYMDPSLPRPTPHFTPLLVCKLFERIGTPHLYQSPVLNSVHAMALFTSAIATKPVLGSYVRCLTIGFVGTLSSFKTLIAKTPALTELRGARGCPSITWKAFSDLGESLSGSNLKVFYGVPIPKASTVAKGATNPAVFASFPRMQKFEWNSSTPFKTEPKLIGVDTFSLLVDLKITTFDESFLDVLSQMELPSLQTAVFAVQCRGGARKLRELTLSVAQIQDAQLAIWHNCPSMQVLTVSCSSKFPATAGCLTSPKDNAALERIVFKKSEDYHRLKQTHKQALNQLMPALASSPNFPALREILHPFCEWPTTEPEISNSRWVKWAETFLERGIHLVGPTGVPWRPRLKFVKSKK